MHRILAVDDDLHFLNSLSNLLKFKNYHIIAVSNPFDVLDRIEKDYFDCLLLDIQMPGIDGFSLLDKIKEKEPGLPVIMISGKSTLNLAAHVMRQGAFDFLEKGGDIDRLLITLKNAIEQRKWRQERSVLVKELSKQYPLIGQSRAMQEVLRQIKSIAPSETSVLITGESGTGKRLIARHIHLNSTRPARPFIPLNCATLSESALELTLGPQNGQNTAELKPDARQGKTVFLNEIGHLSPALQDKLCSLLKPNGHPRPSARLIAATQKDIRQLSKQGKFREDLLQRLSGFRIHLPPLRERLEDIPLLAQHFLNVFGHEYKKMIFTLNQTALDLLGQHDWHDNVRSLRKVMEKIAVIAQKNPITEKEVALALKLQQQEEQAIRNILTLNYF